MIDVIVPARGSQSTAAARKLLKFTPGGAFADGEHVFRKFEEAVNFQALRQIDELDAAIGALGRIVLSQLDDNGPPLSSDTLLVRVDDCLVG
jgi:hypothetical protein